MIYFLSDYMEGAHPEVMRRLQQTNLEQTPGYGADPYTTEAAERIREACECPEARIQFLVGGTQTNATVIDGLLARHEGVLAAESGHINIHEAGAIEASGHKVLTLPEHEGKVAAEEVERYIASFYADATYPHMVAPGMLYISHPTEYGTLYTREELEALSGVCRRHRIPLYIDGARMGYALGAEQNELSLGDIARLADLFYIGGTKGGALFGEALVIPRPDLLPHLMPLVKQHGALLAKGRLLGLQFSTLFTDGLYQRIGAHAVDQAIRIRKAFAERGYEPFINSPTNQQFFRLNNCLIDHLASEVAFDYWGARGEQQSTIRLVTSWATRSEDVDRLIALIDSYKEV